MDEITSVKNPLIKKLRDLSKRQAREETGLFLVEGKVMIREAIKNGLKPEVMLCAEGEAAFAEEVSCTGYAVTPAIMEAVCDTKSPQGVCAAFYMPAPMQIADLPDRVVALDGVQDPGNAGTIWRTADAAGFGAMLLGEFCADPMSPKVQRSAMGSGFRVPFCTAADLPGALTDMRNRGYGVICSDLHGEDFYTMPDPGRKFVLVIGSEAHGISKSARGTATALVKLPMRGGAESLNAAVAAGIMMYELARRFADN